MPLGRGGQGQEQVFPEPLMGQAAEVARDGVGFSVILGEVAPGAVGGGDAEDGVEAGAVVAGAAGASGAADVGEERVPFGIGEEGVGDAEGGGYGR